MSIYTVGPNGLPSLTAAINVAQDGDVIQVPAGVYVDDLPPTIDKHLTISGIGGMAHFTSTGDIPNGKAILVIGSSPTTSSIVTLNYIELSGARVADNNGAGIRYQGGTLNLNNCFIHDNQDGILGNSGTVGVVNMTNCEFRRNGAGDGQTHNIYIETGTLTLTNVYSHLANVGHELKSRSAATTIKNCRFQNETGNASFCLDFPNGGFVLITGSTIHKGINAQNHTCMLAYGEEGTTLNGSLIVQQNTLVNDLPSLHEAIWNASPVSATVNLNSIYNIRNVLAGPGVVSSTATLYVDPALNLNSPFPQAPVPTPTPVPVPVPTPVVSKGTVLALCATLKSEIGANNKRALATLAKIVADVGSL